MIPALFCSYGADSPRAERARRVHMSFLSIWKDGPVSFVGALQQPMQLPLGEHGRKLPEFSLPVSCNCMATESTGVLSTFFPSFGNFMDALDDVPVASRNDLDLIDDFPEEAVCTGLVRAFDHNLLADSAAWLYFTLSFIQDFICIHLQVLNHPGSCRRDAGRRLARACSDRWG